MLHRCIAVYIEVPVFHKTSILNVILTFNVFSINQQARRDCLSKKNLLYLYIRSRLVESTKL